MTLSEESAPWWKSACCAADCLLATGPHILPPPLLAQQPVSRMNAGLQSLLLGDATAQALQLHSLFWIQRSAQSLFMLSRYMR